MIQARALQRERRRSEQRLYQWYFALGVAMFMPMVALGRVFSLGRGVPRKTILLETYEQVQNVLAFVFMA